MTPEAKARLLIDQKLETAGWVVQDQKDLNLGAGQGVAVREYPTDTGPADYLLFVDRQPVGVIEAKRDEAGHNLSVHETQTERYANATLKWRKGGTPLRFLYEGTGQIIYFTDGADPAPRARELFHFFRPQTLADWAAEPDTLRRRLTRMPPLPERNLRDCQINAVTGLEQSLAKNKPRALIHMATGAGKTFTAITSVYRLLKFGGAKRILFLVDTRNLGKQAQQEFMAYTPPDDGRKFTELYNVQRLASSNIDPHAQVCISTIQRMYSILSGTELAETSEDISLNEVGQSNAQAKLVQYNPRVPIEEFDFIVIDECHRSIYNLWKQVLDYFDAFLIGLTATPDKRTYGFFNENVVAEYSYEQSVVDGVNVGYDVYEIETEVTRKGATLVAKEWVDHRDRKTRARRWAQTEEDTAYGATDLDRSVVNPSQIRQVIQAMKTAVETSIFPHRKETPKTLIFAKTDSHADDIIRMVREVYDEGNAFCKKVTYRAGVDAETGQSVAGDDADSVLANFRNDYHPRIAVTVDMIATGTDVKPLEVLLFMRDVRSKGYYEQMKGRGVRSLDAEALKKVSNSADGAKTHFVLVDAVGVEKSLKTESRPLERTPTLSLDNLLKGVAVGARDADTVQSLGNRLVRLAKQLDDKALARIKQASGGIGLQDLARGLVQALDPDRVLADALDAAKAAGITRSQDTVTDAELDAAGRQRVDAACQPFDNPALRDLVESSRRDREQLIDIINTDSVTRSEFAAQAQANAEAAVGRFREFLETHRDEIAALGFFYAQPYRRRELTLDMIDELHDALSRPPLMLTTEKLWTAYARVQESQVRGSGVRRQLTDLVSLVRFALGMDEELRPFADSVDKRFQDWVFRHNARRATAFTPEQMEWLRLVKDHIASSCRIERDDFDYAQLAGKGGLQRAWHVFDGQLDELLAEMNEELVA
ncbi:type I restriction-modification enzyme R subunit C-terminal domain-containing protein [Aerolutibacter ruishenii]|uniref:Type I restriction enzyme R subunit n=1 Tax=Aerolutibacter ruishenii TaxID=686800 RepID=A0A562LRQ8_9GAMM|nr:type I restriction-modification enzyme R subunit C-terminal domain-containing protein [Lysobacter ruishenii]TWI10320.1 type I restriction enzyme R subunit [Lysobacter ruishenii]